MAEESPKRILVVDDEPSICRILTDLLTLDGHAVHIATTPGDAIELCRTRHFDLVFLDFYLPEMTGDKLIAIIKRSSPRQKIVLMTGQRPIPRIGEAEFLIRKPMTVEVIRDMITRFAC